MKTLCHLTDIPDGEGKSFPWQERDLFVIRKGLRAFAYVNRCPHAGTELNWQDGQFMSRDKQFIQCHTHGALFDIETGACLAGPCAGASLARVEISIENGQILLAGGS